MVDSVNNQSARQTPTLIQEAMTEIIFRPEPPGDNQRLSLKKTTIEIDSIDSDYATLKSCLQIGAFSDSDIDNVLNELHNEYDIHDAKIENTLKENIALPSDEKYVDNKVSQALERIALVAVDIIDRMQNTLLKAEALTEIHFKFTTSAKIALRLGWEAMAKHGRFPLPPKGKLRLDKLLDKPSGAMHFVSASDSDAGYFYTMGIALSPEAQALQSMDVSYGLDGELIVPGQAVSPIPPTLALSTRLFAAGIPTSSNISEDIQSIPYSSFAHPDVIDIAPARGYIFSPESHGVVEEAHKATQVVQNQLEEYKSFVSRTTAEEREFLPEVGAAIDVSHLPNEGIVEFSDIILNEVSAEDKSLVSLFVLLEPSPKDVLTSATEFKITERVTRTCEVIDAAKELGLKYVSVCDENEDEWMPNLLEYFTAAELNYIAEYSDQRGVIVCDGRPVDPVYTASTAAQRIQSVFTTLSVDILKMGMWLCLDALSARRVWSELKNNPHIMERMFLMPIGIVEPYSGFVDNRDKTRTPRAIIDPFEKIEFMIEEAQYLGLPSLLTDTRHKSRWVLLGSVDGDLPAHVREGIGATSLIGREKFMACERLARKAGIILGQAGSIENDQIFWIISDTVLDAAQDKQNPATAFWTAETERVLRRPNGASLQGDLQSQRRASVLPYLSITNRAMESHAKVDGWLRYLEQEGEGNESFRQELISQKENVEKLQFSCLDAQEKLNQTESDEDLRKYQDEWDKLSQAFSQYHQSITTVFMKTREQVENLWSGAKA